MGYTACLRKRTVENRGSVLTLAGRTFWSCEIGLLLIFGSSGCATIQQKAYAGPERPRSELGILLLGGGFNENVSKFKTVLVSMDRNSLPESSDFLEPYNTIEVLPGEHELVFDCYFARTAILENRQTFESAKFKNKLSPPQSMQTARFTIIAGHAYNVRYRFIGPTGWGTTKLKSLTVTDAANGEIVFQKEIEGESLPWRTIINGGSNWRRL